MTSREARTLVRASVVLPGQGPGFGDLAPSARTCHGARVQAFLISFGVIFVAELGDKSQLMATTFRGPVR